MSDANLQTAAASFLERLAAKRKTERTIALVRSAEREQRRIKTVRFFTPTLLERLGIGSFSLRVQREVNLSA
jgi:hypothetical protein